MTRRRKAFSAYKWKIVTPGGGLNLFKSRSEAKSSLGYYKSRYGKASVKKR